MPISFRGANIHNNALAGIKDKLHSVGWFMPPYTMVGFLQLVASTITRKNGQFTQDDLEAMLAFVYEPESLAPMVLDRYPKTPIIELFKQTISEAVQAHFSGLHHVAVGGLIPVVEGAGRLLANKSGLNGGMHIKVVFRDLASHTKADVIKRQFGATDEIVDMLDSFLGFIENYFYSQSHSYPFDDGTNRHGIEHGAYTDADYGRPLNFYKTIAAIDFLTFISSLSTPYPSGFAPNPTPESQALAARYLNLIKNR